MLPPRLASTQLILDKQVWQQLLSVHSLAAPPAVNLDTQLKFAELCQASNRSALALSILRACGEQAPESAKEAWSGNGPALAKAKVGAACLLEGALVEVSAPSGAPASPGFVTDGKLKGTLSKRESFPSNGGAMAPPLEFAHALYAWSAGHCEEAIDAMKVPRARVCTLCGRARLV